MLWNVKLSDKKGKIERYAHKKTLHNRSGFQGNINRFTELLQSIINAVRNLSAVF